MIDKYDQYSIANWLNEKLPDFTTLERLHYKVITGLGPYLHDNLINSVTSDILHYEKVCIYANILYVNMSLKYHCTVE